MKKAYLKVLAIILSCHTVPQLAMADTMVSLFKMRYPEDPAKSPNGTYLLRLQNVLQIARIDIHYLSIPYFDCYDGVR